VIAVGRVGRTLFAFNFKAVSAVASGIIVCQSRAIQEHLFDPLATKLLAGDLSFLGRSERNSTEGEGPRGPSEWE